VNRRQGGHQIRHVPIFHADGLTIYLDQCLTAKNVQENLHSLPRRKQLKNNRLKALKRPVGDGNLSARAKTILDCKWCFLFKALLQFCDHYVCHRRNSLAKMHQRADARDITDLIQSVARAAHEDVTRKKRLDDSHRPAAGRSLDSQSWIENLQAKVPPQIRRGDMLVLRFGPSTIPRHVKIVVHFKYTPSTTPLIFDKKTTPRKFSQRLIPIIRE